MERTLQTSSRVENPRSRLRVSITTEIRFFRTPDGRVWTKAQGTYSLWSRYLAVFDEVNCIARIQEVPSVPADSLPADGEGVSFSAVPFYLGPVQYLRRMRQVNRAVKSAIGPTDAVMLRVVGTLGSIAFRHLSRLQRPFALDVLGDPHDIFAPGGVHHPLRPFLRWYVVRLQKQQCAAAPIVGYVTRHALQRRYPSGGLSFGVSDVVLPDDAIVGQPREYRAEPRPMRLVSVVSFDQLYKGQDVLIQAVARLRQAGLDVRLDFIGDGKHRAEMEMLAAGLNLGKHVRFLGKLPAGEAVRARLDEADVFVLPSLAEGLPRAPIEAMARALPCIGSTVGGFPELLHSADLVPPGDVDALAGKIREVVTDPERMRRMSARNLAEAGEYRDSVLTERRLEYWRAVRRATEEWLESRRGMPLIRGTGAPAGLRAASPG
jgi:glycosyltransferase involved in cell wall biosynthesis